ncbi:hypothetical protein DYU11_23845 [Fibrisoma montanum]|uniref:Lipoprotein n=1 Tax=Fibrisoma montanum TaxID=2305895 RepID=A0A418M2I4_9BACT|nr:hypothetical protein [Fibrisoma montanum]RIV19952.1 hypothetical protein DYU11_23845 [Fibrisoma montanum]
MHYVKPVPVFALLLLALCGCQDNVVERQKPPTQADGFMPNGPSEGPGGVTTNPGGQPLPYPTITRQTFIPEYSLYAHTKCHTWRIEWPIYPASTDPNKIPTVFTLSNGALNSFDFLNGQPASTTYKTHFNLYHNDKLEMSSTLWDELIHTFESGSQMETTWFNKVNISVKGLENMVKNRPGLFETNWVDNNQEPPVYQQGDVFLFKVMNLTDPTIPNRYGGIRIVSMSPRIIEVYLAVPNN